MKRNVFLCFFFQLYEIYNSGNFNINNAIVEDLSKQANSASHTEMDIESSTNLNKLIIDNWETET